jgi:hypothetical protein
LGRTLLLSAMQRAGERGQHTWCWKRRTRTHQL